MIMKKFDLFCEILVPTPFLHEAAFYPVETMAYVIF